MANSALCSLQIHNVEAAMISRLPKILGLFCRISSLLQGSFTKETYNLKANSPCGDVCSYTIYFTHLYKCLQNANGALFGLQVH